MTNPTSTGKYLILHCKFCCLELTVRLPDSFFWLQGLQTKTYFVFLVTRESRMRQPKSSPVGSLKFFRACFPIRPCRSSWLCYTETLLKRTTLSGAPPPSAVHWPLLLPVSPSRQEKLLSLSHGGTVSLLSRRRVHVITREEMPSGCGMTAALLMLLLLQLPATSLAQSGDSESVNMGEEAVSDYFNNKKSDCRITWKLQLLGMKLRHAVIYLNILKMLFANSTEKVVEHVFVFKALRVLAMHVRQGHNNTKHYF